MEGIILALVVCLVLALITKKFSLPTIPFYILAGLALGASGLGWVESDEISRFLTELGLIFLLFFMGLEIKPDRIISNRAAILKSGILDLNINALIGFAAAFLLGFSLAESLVIAAAFFISSTAMAVTSLVENHKLMMREAETIIWLMIFEDLVLVLVLALMGPSTDHPLLLLVKTIAFLLVLIVVVRGARKSIIAVMKRDDELPVILTFATVLGIAGFSMQIGVPQSFMVIAFGTILGTIDPSVFERHSRPFKDVFLIVFFVFFGIGVDLFAGGLSLVALAGMSIVAIASKLVSGIAIGKYVHGSSLSGIEVWSNTTARGEFSIALAAMFGSAAVSGIIAAVVITTSIVGAFIAISSTRITGWAALLLERNRVKEGGTA